MARSQVDICNLALGRIGEDKIQSLEDATRPAEACNRLYLECVRQTLERFPWPFAITQAALAATFAEYDSSTSYSTGDVVRVDQLLYTSLVDGNVGADVSDTTAWRKTRPFGVGWDYVYNLPADCVTPLALLCSGQRSSLLAEDDKIPFELTRNTDGSGLVLLTDSEWDVDFDALEYVGIPGSEDASGAWVENPALYPSQFVDALTCILGARLALEIPKDTNRYRELMAFFREAVDQASVDAANAKQRDQGPTTPSIAARD